MKITFPNYDEARLTVDNFTRIEDRIRFRVSVILCDKKTDTDIRFDTESFICIDDWLEKGQALLTTHCIELDNFSFRAVYQTYSIDGQNVERSQNFIELSSCTNNSKLELAMEARENFERKFFEVIADQMLSTPNLCDASHVPCKLNRPLFIDFKVIRVYTDGRSDIQLNVHSDSFHLVRNVNYSSEETDYVYEQIQRFNKKLITYFDVTGEFVELEFRWVDGKKTGKGSISDFASPGPNDFTFDDCVELRWEETDWKTLPPVPSVIIPPSEFNPSKRM